MHFQDRKTCRLKRSIANCGLDCEACDAYIITKDDDQALRIPSESFPSPS